jgi:hypothetical protein
MAKNPNIPDAPTITSSAYAFGGSKAADTHAQSEFGKALAAIRPIQRGIAPMETAVAAPTFAGSDSGLTVRQGMSRVEYGLWRPGENIPIQHQHVLAFAMGAYERVDIIRNVIDSMADFTAQGIKIVHQNQG